MNVLVTGAAGFIGLHVAERLLARGDRVVGLDVLSDSDDMALKRARLARLTNPGFTFVHGDIAEQEVLDRSFAEPIDCVVHLAAQVGVRHSVAHTAPYIDTNLVGFSRVIEAAHRHRVGHFIYASSSSVYGNNDQLPWCETHTTEQSINLSAATEKANELIAHSYSHLYALATTGLRFFTVYGPWGRPDMAFFTFAENILAGRPIRLFGHGAVRRDFTYIDDVANAVVALVDRPPARETSPTQTPYRILNVGNQTSIEVPRLIALLEEALGVAAIVEPVPMQQGDILATCADVSALEALIGPWHATPLELGVKRFVKWYRGEYRPLN